MKLDLLQEEHSDEEIQIELQIQQKQKEKSRILKNSIEPKSGHKLFEFILDDEGDFKVFETDFRKGDEIVFTWNGTAYVRKQKEKVNINIFDFLFIDQTKSMDKERFSLPYKEGVSYITALNYDNAVKKFKKLNPDYFN